MILQPDDLCQIQNLLLDTSKTFNEIYQGINQKVQKKQQKVQINAQELLTTKIQQMNFEDEETLDNLLTVIPAIYNQQLYEEIDKIKVRSIPNERRGKLFSGFLSLQKYVIQQKLNSVPPIKNIVPDNYKAKVEFKIENQDNSAFQHFSLSSEDLERLNKNVDVNDNIIQSYFKIMRLFMINPEIVKQTYFFSTFFMGKLMGDLLQKQDSKDQRKSYLQVQKKIKQNYVNVKKWYRKVNLFKYKYLVVPINYSSHWNCMLVINADLAQTQIQKCQIVGLDSMWEIKMMFPEVLKMFLQLQMLEKNQKEVSLFRISYTQILVPRQTNHHDCGLYVMAYIERFFSNEKKLQQLETNVLEYLDLFAQQFMFTIRGELKNLYYKLMISSKNSQRILHIKEYIKSRKEALEKYTEYDRISSTYFEKYSKLIPNYCEQNEDKILIKFYLDSQINYYQKDGPKEKQ